MMQFDYPTDPLEIERRSFAQIRQLTDLSRFDPEQQQVAMRLVHTSGDPSIVNDLRFSPNAVTAAENFMFSEAWPIGRGVELIARLSKRLLSSPDFLYRKSKWA